MYVSRQEIYSFYSNNQNISLNKGPTKHEAPPFYCQIEFQMHLKELQMKKYFLTCITDWVRLS